MPHCLIFDRLCILLIIGEPPPGNIDPLLVVAVVHCSQRHILSPDGGGVADGCVKGGHCNSNMWTM